MTAVWVGASAVLGRPVPTTGPYPHVCRRSVTGTSGRRVYLTARQCAACAQERQPRPAGPTGNRPPVGALPVVAAPVRVLVTGSRTWTDTTTVAAALDALHAEHGRALVVVHGACPHGADAIADGWATRNGVTVERHPVDWATGRRAGPQRNTAMVATAPVACLAFIRNQSPGATHCARTAQAAGIPVTLYRQDDTTVDTSTYRRALLRHALRYTELGWPVFILGRNKRPVANCPTCPTTEQDSDHDREACACLTCHGFYAATLDPDRVTAMLDAHPTGLLAIRTGTAAGLVVVDIDPRHGGRIDPALMPRTRHVATGSGGWHLFYTYPAGGVGVPSSEGRVAPGVDIKADGGYVVAAPSIHPRTGRPYRWASAGPITEMAPDLITACQPAPPATPAGPAAMVAVTDPDRLLAAHLSAVARAPVGRRRRTLYGAARGAARMVAAGALTPEAAQDALTRAGRDAQQTTQDIRNAIVGGFRAEGVAA
jgi:bifunctional DNA primase/polymerase-like protein/SLOG family YspA-like protein